MRTCDDKRTAGGGSYDKMANDGETQVLLTALLCLG
jgi:hypothetical protein